jgi:hypothetical protein
VAINTPVITIKAVTETTVTVTVAAPSAGATRYAIRILDANGLPAAHDSITSAYTSGTRDVALGNDSASNAADYELTPGSLYSAQIKAGDAGTTWSAWSVPIEFRTLGNPPPPAALAVPLVGVKAPYVGADWSASYGGVLLGGDSAIVLNDVSGLLDAPDLRVTDKALLQRNGLTTSTDYLGARIVQLSMTVLEGAQNVSDALAAFQPGADLKPFRFAFPGIAGGRGWTMAKVRKRSMPMNGNHLAGAVTLNVELFCPDPLLYDDAEATVRILPLPGRGSVAFFAPRLKFPLKFTGGKSGGSDLQVPIMALGNADTWPVYTITGPVNNPSVINRGTGERITVQLNVPTREVLTIDTARRSVLLNGASRYGNLSPDSTWFPLRPGRNDLIFDDLLGDKARNANATWRSAWL